MKKKDSGSLDTVQNENVIAQLSNKLLELLELLFATKNRNVVS